MPTNCIKQDMFYMDAWNTYSRNPVWQLGTQWLQLDLNLEDGGGWTGNIASTLDYDR